MYPKIYKDFTTVHNKLIDAFGMAPEVFTEQWQSRDPGEPIGFREILNTSFQVIIPQTVEALTKDTQPNKEWVLAHFEERIGGEPLNPGETFKLWPAYKNNKSNDTFRTEDEKFSHTYMERYWAKKAGIKFANETELHMVGIRYAYGDLWDVVKLLHSQPNTRQAYLPVWFPEDTGVVHGERVPCSIGYHFIIRDNKLHIHYFLRSCDMLRHFRDDMWLTARLAQWVVEQLISMDPVGWEGLSVGVQWVNITSLHIFSQESTLISKKKINAKKDN